MAQWTSSNWNSGDEYECSGTPFVTSSNGTEVDNSTPVKIKFPRVTRWIQIFNNNATAGQTLKIGFTDMGVTGPHEPYNVTGSNRNYFVVRGATNSGRLELRTMEVHLLAGTGDDVDFTVLAGLTNIPENRMFALTGSNEIQGVG